VSEATGTAPEYASELLSGLRFEGLVVRRDTERGERWIASEDGRVFHRTLLAGVLAPKDRSRAVDLYRQFGVVNREFKEVCGAWQLLPSADGAVVLNDHSDPDYDMAVRRRLQKVHGAALPLLAAIVDVLPRMNSYRARLDLALERAVGSLLEDFTLPLSSSYHDVWMELHQDLLVTLNIGRTEEDV